MRIALDSSKGKSSEDYCARTIEVVMYLSLYPGKILQSQKILAASDTPG